MDQHSSVGIAVRCWLDGPRIEYWCRRDFPHQFRPALGPTQVLYSGYRVFFFARVMQLGRGVGPNNPHLAPMLKKEESYN